MARIALLTAAVAAVLLGGTAGFAQDSPLDRAKARVQAADQRAEADVKDALADADKLARAYPANAVRRLKNAIFALDKSIDISSEKREALVKQLQDKIAAIEGKPTPDIDPKIKTRKADQKKAEEAARLEAKEVQAAVAEIERLTVQNRTREADAKVAELARKYPNNPATLVLTGQWAVANRVAVARQLAKEQSERNVFAMNDMARSALLPKGDMEFPQNWKELTERRRKMTEVQLSPEEQSILEALDKRVGNGLKDAPFLETVQQLSTLIDKPIYLDKKSLEDAGLDMQRPVTMPGGVTARTALRAVLQSQGLTYIVKDKVIQVVTLEKAKETLVTRAYYLGDVIALTGPFAGATTWGPIADYQQTMANAKMIVDAITASVDPLVWNTGANRGPATIVFHPPSMSLIVRAPAEVHATLNSKLR